MAIDWREAAQLTAAGWSNSDITAAVGCSRSALHRRRTRCPLFRALVAAYVGQMGRNPDGTGASAPPDIESAIREKVEQEVTEGNLKVALWLAERLRLFTPDSRSASEATLQRLIDSMTPEERAAFAQRD